MLLGNFLYAGREIEKGRSDKTSAFFVIQEVLRLYVAHFSHGEFDAQHTVLEENLIGRVYESNDV